jgi:two-component system, chemotaxis family, protein-glutamate methylesterase/glutaminase
MRYPFKIIAIGISAGGQQPLRAILQMLPHDLNAAIVVVPHLFANYRSRLDRILATSLSRPVHRMQDGLEIVSGGMYVLPEGKIAGLHNGKFTLSPRPETEKINQAIDHFFKSLATEAGSQSIGVVLSGAGFDGISGAKAIEGKNGIVIVQDPKTAEFPLMPKGLIVHDDPDYILTPEQIADMLIHKCNVAPAGTM